jgi:phosphoadenosine phosphosulfate reductase
MTANSLADLSDGHLIATVAVKARRAVELLREVAQGFSPAVFANSLGAEDMVLTDLIVRKKLGIEIVSVDTGRLPPESHDLMAELEKHYGIQLNVYYPRHDLVQAYVREQGINGLYDSVAQREACCEARKIEPLRRALEGKKALVSGLRADATGTDLAIREFDVATGLDKFNPLADWSEREIWSYIRTRALPYNRLHDQHYPIIGCSPCTRPVGTGGDVRGGRWWWESADTFGLPAAKRA